MSKILFTLQPINHFHSRKEWEEACWKEILKSRNLLELLVTPYERHNIIMRAAVMDNVNLGKKFQQIVEELRLSPQTISSIKKAVKENNYRSYRDRSKTERKKKLYSHYTSQGKRKHRGRSVRTKYGIVYLP